MLEKLKNHPEARVFCLLAAGIILIFGQTAFFNFIALDDSKHIWSNNYVNTLSWKHLKFFWEQPYYGLYIPVIYNSWAVLAEITQALGLTHEVSGYSASLFHLTNTVIHMLNTLLVFQIFTYLLTQQNQQAESGNNYLLAIFGTMVFAIHPLQVEAVAWASGLKDVLSTFLALVSMTLFLRFHQSGLLKTRKSRKQKKNKDKAPETKEAVALPLAFQALPEKNQRIVTFVLAFGFFLLAMFAKPSVVVLPAVLFVLVGVWLGQRQQLRPLILFFMAVVPIVFLTKSLQPNARLEFSLEAWQYPLIALHALGFYISKIFVPFGLAPDYGLSPDVALTSGSFYLYSALGLVPLGMAAWAFHKKDAALISGSLIFLGGLFPVLGFVPFEYQNMSTVADRYLYFVPLFGFGLMLMSFAGAWSEKNLRTTIILVGVVLTALSFQQTRHWKDNASLFAQVLKINPNSYLSLNNLGLVHLRADEFEPAETYFKQALQIKANYTAAQSNLGVVYFKQKLYDKVIEHYTEILKDKPNLTAGSSATYADMHYNLGAALLNTGKTRESIEHLNKAAEININHFAAQFHRGRVYAHINDLENAKMAFLHAYRINPKSSEVVAELKKLREKGVQF